MNELTALEQFGRSLDAPATPERLRHRVLTALADGPSRPPRRPARPRLKLAFTGAAATVLAGAILLTTQLMPNPPTASAAELILRGAAEEATRHVPPVRGDQFVYVESVASTLTVNEAAPDQARVLPQERQAWLSVDGTRDGLVHQRSDGGPWQDIALPGCRDGVITQTKGGTTVRQPCEPTPGYRSGLPATEDDMLAYLRKAGEGTKNPPDQAVFTAAGDLIREGNLPPAVLAATFKALARIPGVTVVGDVTDAAGRSGVAVTLTVVQGTREELIFDRQSNAYLGERSVQVNDGDGLKAGQLAGASAVLRVAVVDQAGQRP